ncbi:MATE family efflux transporter [Fulvivirgaceae bacterium BMA10]|uniref:MATE family efflux transporter n=1 Tax=Splendidivirga corallicola TaxID=3051826 RepID=A0ABT8KXQ0_9BACT|nr:MATE family efflux transporter [Fulvivirgaceae bacterium BMA10]
MQKLNQEILKLAVPNIISNLSVPLLSVVDIALMGHLEYEHYILAVGFGAVIFNFLYWGFGFLRMGTTGFTAQAYGNNNFEESFLILSRGMAVALVGGLLLITFQYPLLKLSLLLIGAKGEVAASLIDYYHARILAAPAILSFFVIIGWFLGMQNSRIPMILIVLVNLTNIGANFFFVEYLGMKAEGVAWGTVIAQYIGLLVGVFFVLKDHRQLFDFWNLSKIFNLQALKKFFSVNIDIILRTLCLIFAFSFFKVQSSYLGSIIGAANIVLLEFITIAAYGIDGFAFAAESISGKYFGARDEKKLKSSILYLFIWGLGTGVLFIMVFSFFGNEILHLLTDQEPVFTKASEYLIWLIISPLAMIAPFIWDGVYIGVTASKAMRNSMMIATFLFFLPAFYLFKALYGNHGIWLAFIIFFLARGVVQSILAKKVIYRF